MARYRFKTVEELISEYGVYWYNEYPSWNDDMQRAAGRFVDEIFSAETVSRIKDISKGVRSVYFNARILNRGTGTWKWNYDWLVEGFDGINVRLIQQGDKQVSKGSLYKYNENFYLVEKINKRENVITLNDTHDLRDCDIIDDDIKKELT